MKTLFTIALALNTLMGTASVQNQEETYVPRGYTVMVTGYNWEDGNIVGRKDAYLKEMVYESNVEKGHYYGYIYNEQKLVNTKDLGYLSDDEFDSIVEAFEEVVSDWEDDFHHVYTYIR